MILKFPLYSLVWKCSKSDLTPVKVSDIFEFSTYSELFIILDRSIFFIETVWWLQGNTE